MYGQPDSWWQSFTGGAVLHMRPSCLQLLYAMDTSGRRDADAKESLDCYAVAVLTSRDVFVEVSIISW